MRMYLHVVLMLTPRGTDPAPWASALDMLRPVLLAGVILQLSSLCSGEEGVDRLVDRLRVELARAPLLHLA